MKIGIVGLGYVGLPLAVAFVEEGHEVVGVDTGQPNRAANVCATVGSVALQLVQDSCRGG